MQCCYRTVDLINKNMAAAQVSSQRAASDALLAGYPWRIGSLYSLKRALFFAPFQIRFMCKVLWYLQALRPASSASEEQYVFLDVSVPRS